MLWCLLNVVLKFFLTYDRQCNRSSSCGLQYSLQFLVDILANRCIEIFVGYRFFNWFFSVDKRRKHLRKVWFWLIYTLTAVTTVNLTSSVDIADSFYCFTPLLEPCLHLALVISPRKLITQKSAILVNEWRDWPSSRNISMLISC